MVFVSFFFCGLPKSVPRQGSSFFRVVQLPFLPEIMRQSEHQRELCRGYHSRMCHAAQPVREFWGENRCGRGGNGALELSTIQGVPGCSRIVKKVLAIVLSKNGHWMEVEKRGLKVFLCVTEGELVGSGTEWFLGMSNLSDKSVG